MQVTFLPTGERILTVPSNMAHRVPIEPKPLPRALAMAAIAFQTVALFKLTVRDPLATDVGIQASFEVACTILSLFFACWAQLVSRRRIPIKAHYTTLAIVYLICLVASINSFYPMLSAAKAVLYLFNLVSIVLATRQIGADSALNTIYWTLFWSVILGLAYGAYRPDLYPLFVGEYGNWRSRLAVLALHPGILAEMASIALLIGASPRTSKRWATQLFFVVVLLLTVARTSIVVALVLLVLAGAKKNLAAARRTLILTGYASTVILLIVAVILVQGDLVQPIFGYLDSVYLRTVNDTTLSGRSLLWAPAFDILMNSWAFGYGIGGARGQLLSTLKWAGEAHNSFLDIGLACGLVGGAIFLFTWLLIIRQGLREFGRAYYYRLLMHAFLFAVSWVGALMSLGSTIGVLTLVILATEDPTINCSEILRRAESALRSLQPQPQA